MTKEIRPFAVKVSDDWFFEKDTYGYKVQHWRDKEDCHFTKDAGRTSNTTFHHDLKAICKYIVDQDAAIDCTSLNDISLQIDRVQKDLETAIMQYQP